MGVKCQLCRLEHAGDQEARQCRRAYEYLLRKVDCKPGRELEMFKGVVGIRKMLEMETGEHVSAMMAVVFFVVGMRAMRPGGQDDL